MFASRALVVSKAVWTAVYLTGYSDTPAGSREPLSPPCSYHTGLRKGIARSLQHMCFVLFKRTRLAEKTTMWGGLKGCTNGRGN